jgi:hypothetical protein
MESWAGRKAMAPGKPDAVQANQAVILPAAHFFSGWRQCSLPGWHQRCFSDGLMALKPHLDSA